MKKLIFRNFAKDTMSFFLIMCLTIGIIVWTLQAVNYFDFVSEDGHGLKTYFSYIILNFPKIIHRIIPFIFFISLFYILNHYEFKNELQIFWTFGITKIQFANKILLLSLFLTIFQIWFGSFLSPYSQLKGRELLKTSNMDFFTSLIKEGKFINVVEGLTIFIDKKDSDKNFTNIFIDDSSKKQQKMIYAKKGQIVENDKKKLFILNNGQILNKEKSKFNIFQFEEINFDLSDYTSNTILAPKIQEIKSTQLLRCYSNLYRQLFVNQKNYNFSCEKSILKEIKQELLKRFYKPFYIPVVALISCLLILIPKNNIRYAKSKNITFLLGFFVLVISESMLRYSTSSSLFFLFYLMTPFLILISTYFFIKQSKYV